MKRVIKWQSQHLEIDTITGKLQEPQEPEYNDFGYYDGQIMDEGQQNTPIQHVMSTPFGFWRVDDTMNPFKQFKMWIGHTNFTITPEIVQIIKNVPGVEVLQIMTRYRFVIGVGELFDIHDIRVTIENSLQCNRDASNIISDKKLLDQVYELRQQLSSYDKWAIYVFPNGEIDFTTSNEENFIQQLNTYKQAVDYSNGVLIESDNG